MRRLPWAIWLLTVAVFVAIVPSAFDDGLGLFLSYVLFVLAFSTVGALVASRQPRNAIGWLLLLAGASYVLGGVSASAGDDPPALVAWFGEWIWLVGVGPVATFGLLLFPTGHLPSPRCSGRCGRGSRARSTVASTAAATTPPARSRRSAAGCARRSIWRR